MHIGTNFPPSPPVGFLKTALAWTVTQLAYNVLWYKDILSKGNELVCVTLPTYEHTGGKLMAD